MKEPLEIRAINVKNHIGIPAAEITLSILTQEDEEKMKDILNKCRDDGIFLYKENDVVKQFFSVKQILYRGQWDRFEGHGGEPTAFNNYIMPFDQFQKLGRPKKIYIDFYNSVSLKD